jgi:hypothetical protein
MLLMIEERSRITDSLDRIPLKIMKGRTGASVLHIERAKFRTFLEHAKLFPLKSISPWTEHYRNLSNVH